MKKSFKETSQSFLSLFFISIALVLIVKLGFNLLALGFIERVWDLDAQTVFYDLENGIFNLIYAHKILAFFDQIGTFLLPSLLMFFIFKILKPTYTNPNKNDLIKLVLFFILLVGITQLLTFISIKIGYDFFPASIRDYLKTQQEFNANLQEKFIGTSFKSFLFNLMLLALIPALGEELFFRGLIQNIFIGVFKNTHAGIIFTSIVFGLLHFQIDNLLAIIFASILFGYVYEKSKNLLLTIILHFSFNFFALLCMQAIKSQLINETKIELVAFYGLVPASIIIGIVFIKKKVFWAK